MSEERVPHADAGSGKPWSRHTAAKRAAIIAAAVQIFTRDGFDGAGVDEIAAIAHVGKQTIYNYFDDKQGLFRAAIEQPDAAADGADDGEGRAPISDLSELFPMADAPLSVLTRLGERILDTVLDPDRAALHRLTIAELGRHPELQRMWSDKAGDQVTSGLAEYLERLTAAGRLTVHDPMLAARQFVVLLAAEARALSAYGTRALGTRQRREIARRTAGLIVRASRNDGE